MALPAGRYGVTKNQLLKIKKLPMNTIKLIEELTEKFDLLGSAAFKNSTSVVTDSSDLVESGAVENIIGWENKNLFSGFSSNYSNYHVIATVNADKTVTVTNDGSSASANAFIEQNVNYTFPYPVILSGCPTNGSDASYRLDANGSYADYGEGVTIPANTNITKIRIRIANGYTPTNLVFEPMIRKADVTDATYEPYHASVEESKCDNSVIAPVENGSTASQAYAVGSHAIRNGAFITWKNAKAQGETINDASDYTSGDVASVLDTVEDITSEFTFSNDITVNTIWTHIIKKGNVIKGTLRFITPSTVTMDKVIATFPAKYVPKEAFAAGNTNKSVFIGAVHKIWSGEVDCLFTCNGTNNYYTLASNVYTPSTEVLVTFTYLV